MSLKICNLTKVYGQQHAVRNISFEVGPGEIVGFLGPNGAGKSTTMKIATSYLAPSSGTVLVGGLDVVSKPIEVKKMVGYLPEHNPLYLDLYVHEYLRFVGNLYGLKGSKLRSRVGEMIEVCGLTREQNKRMEELSKGYRQRVGLAQAMLHDPAVLILDEPTTGLDPNQLLEIRKLIKDTSRAKTVLFSTHIMQEVQAICDRVVVINKGEIVADDSLSKLLANTSGQRVMVVEFESAVDTTKLESIPGVLRMEKIHETHYRIVSANTADIRPEIFKLAAEHQWALVGLKQEEVSLENIFRELTTAAVSE